MNKNYNVTKLKTIEQVLLTHVDLESTSPQGEKHWVNSDVFCVYRAMNEYSDQTNKALSDELEKVKENNEFLKMRIEHYELTQNNKTKF